MKEVKPLTEEELDQIPTPMLKFALEVIKMRDQAYLEACHELKEEFKHDKKVQARINKREKQYKELYGLA